MSKTWIYHKTESPMLVEDHRAEEYYKQGWSDTPATFLNQHKEDDKPNQKQGASNHNAIKQENGGVTKEFENYHIDQKGEKHGKNHPSNEHEPGVGEDEREANEADGKREKARKK